MEEILDWDKPIVSIRCTVYNHEPYLRQCLDGFVMQKTLFPFEAIVHDDASTDKSADIIREYAAKYPHIIKPVYQKENQYSKHDDSIDRYLREATSPYARYFAFCEGDDYWTDPNKLQKQVDFMEEHPEYGLVHTYFNFVDIHSNIIPPPNSFYEQLQSRIIDGYVWDYYLLNSGFILTCTCMYRRTLYQEKEQYFFDHGLFMMIARQSKIYCIREVTAAYRRNPTGAMCTASTYYNKLTNRAVLYQLYYYLKGFPCDVHYKNNRSVTNRIGMAYTYLFLKAYKVLNKEDCKILFDITCARLSLLLALPLNILKVARKKMLKDRK